MPYCEDFCGLKLGNSKVSTFLSLRHGLGSAFTSYSARLFLAGDLHSTFLQTAPGYSNV